MQLFLDEAISVLGPLLDRVEPPDAVLYDIGGFAGRVAAVRWGVPAVQLSPTYVAWEGCEQDTASFALMVAGLLLLSQVDVSSSETIPIIAMIGIGIGIGIGIVFPMATVVVQSAVPMSMMGVGTSQVQFWRMLAGPVSLAVLGSVMSLRVGGDVQAGGGSVPPEILVGALQQMFIVDAVIVAIGLVATLFLKEIAPRQSPKAAGAKQQTGAVQKEPEVAREGA